MTLYLDLLHQADYLSKREPKRPRQASLRRAISAAYYALFHLLTFEASRLFAKDPRLVNCINRVYSHGSMFEVSRSFSNGDWPGAFNQVKSTILIPQELKDVARTFMQLQNARHDADYNLSVSFTRNDVVIYVKQSKQAIEDWKKIRRSDLARIYLASFLLAKQWEKSR